MFLLLIIKIFGYICSLSFSYFFFFFFMNLLTRYSKEEYLKRYKYIEIEKYEGEEKGTETARRTVDLINDI